MESKMNKITKILLSLLFSSLMFVNGCDELNNLDLDIPLDIEIYSHGPNTTTSESEYFCLSQYKDWRDNQEDIESAKFLEASYWTLKSTPNLQGDITITLAVGNGAPFFTKTYSNVKPAEFMGDNSKKLDFTEAEIQAMDEVLLGILELADKNACFTAGLKVSNITGDKNPITGEYELLGQVTIVLSTVVKL